MHGFLWKPPLVDGCLRVLEIGHAESHRFAGDDFMRRVGQFDQHFVWARFQADYDHRLTARVDKVPGRVVDGNMDMADVWRDIEGELCRTPGPRVKFSVRY